MRLSLVGAEPAWTESAPSATMTLSHTDTTLALLLDDPFLPSVHVYLTAIEEEEKKNLLILLGILGPLS